MWQIHVRTFVAESELQDGHPRNLQAVAQRVHLRSDVTQVLGKEGQATERLADFGEQVVTRAVDPVPIDGSGFARGNLPELIEAPEVIEADVVTILGGPAEAL